MIMSKMLAIIGTISHKLTNRKEQMTQRTEELRDEMVLETTDKDREERYQRQKIIFLEDKINVLEKSVERLNKLMGDMMGVKE